MKKMTPPAWRTEPISCTCEVMLSATVLCDEPTTHAYPSMGCGWMALCEKHSKRHLPNGAIPVEELIAKGETWR